MTARWVVDEVAPRRDLNLIWQPISLLFKNQPPPGSDYHEGSVPGHRSLRVMEAIRSEQGDGPVFDWYWQCATRIHHDGERPLDIPAALAAAGFDPAFAYAADDESWDAEIRSRMNQGLALVGDDVGTPIIAFRCPDGTKRGIFGPVITKVPDPETAVKFWDAMEVFVTTDGFWELKRTRTQRPEFGERPAV
ncbi:MAG: disulfide bond formation protein DsbA [Ilumatobacteraceae bacterium]